MRARWQGVAALALFASCAAPSEMTGQVTGSGGPVSAAIESEARTAGVPRDLFAAIAAVEGGLLLAEARTPIADDHVPVAGAIELRHGAFNSLARGALLVGASEADLIADWSLGTRAGALVLAELGRSTGAQPDDLASWQPAVLTLSGIRGPERDRYLHDVYARLHDGGLVRARGGERVLVWPHAEVVVPDAPRTIEGTPDYPGAIWFDTSCTGKCDTTRTAGNSVVNQVAIHDTEGGWSGSVATLQNDPGKSVHYIVDADGSRVGQFVPETYTAWHVGNYYYNQRMVGIEHVGFASPGDYSDGLYATSVKLVQNIQTRWPVPTDRKHIIGHYQVPDGTVISESAPACSDTLASCESSPDYGGANNHRDPGLNWQWCQYMERLGGHCECNDAWPLWNCTTDKTEAVRCHNGVVEIAQCAPCESMKVGVDDVCHMAAAAPDLGAQAFVDLAASIPIDAAATGVDAANATGKPDSGCGCALGSVRRTPIDGVLALAFLVAVMQRRRRSGRRAL